MDGTTKDRFPGILEQGRMLKYDGSGAEKADYKFICEAPAPRAQRPPSTWDANAMK